MQNMTMDLIGSSRDHTLYGPSKGPRFGPQIQGPECGTRIGTKILSLIIGPIFGPSLGTISMWFQNYGPSYPWTLKILVPMHRSSFCSLCMPMYRSIFWTFMKVQNLDLGLKVFILQEGPHRSMKDNIGTMVMFYIRSDN